jgi:2-aminoethylphosphonate-pyruvate transaminase
MEIFCDFDGTITTKDTLDFIIETYYGKIQQQIFERELLDGKIEHNKQLSEIFINMNHSLNDVLNLIGGFDFVDNTFQNFYWDCIRRNIRFYIISAGFKQVINHFLPYIGSDFIYANDYDDLSNLKPLDKLKIVNSLRTKGKKCVYIGDGASDLHMSGHTDILFVKKDSILEMHCQNNDILYKTFSNFNDIDNILFNQQDKYKLLSPGVVRVSKNVCNALAHQHIFMHRHEQFRLLYDKIDSKLKNLVCQNPNDYITLLVTGSGTSSMDEVINAHVHKDKTLILSNGMFGERWSNIAKFYNPENTFELLNEWGAPFDLNKVGKLIMENSIKNVLVVHCDTSVGILNDIHQIGLFINNINPDITYIVDSVSTFGGIPIDMDASHIHFLVTNPNKALAAHMGVGIIIGRHEKFDQLSIDHSSSYSLNLKKHYDHALHKETCNSVSISCLNALLESLNNSFCSKSAVLDNHERFKKLFNLCYYGIKYNKLLSHEISSPCIITILADNSDKVIEYLLNNNFVVYECKGNLLNKGFQISFYGADGVEKNILKLIEIINSYCV